MAKIDTTVGHLVDMIERGELRLPEMQRRYVWTSTAFAICSIRSIVIIPWGRSRRYPSCVIQTPLDGLRLLKQRTEPLESQS